MAEHTVKVRLPKRVEIQSKDLEVQVKERRQCRRNFEDQQRLARLA